MTTTWLKHKRWSFQNIPQNIPYFLSAASTTARARNIDSQGFEIHLRHASFGKAAPEECECLGINLRDCVWIREVSIRLLSMPVMFARIIIPYPALEKSFRRIKHLDELSLGRYLFRLPEIKRGAFEIKLLQQGDFLFEKMVALKTYPAISSSDKLWARRSIFRKQQSTLLLTEVFLPKYSDVF